MKSLQTTILVLLFVLILVTVGEAQKKESIPSNMSSCEYGMLNYNIADSEAAKKLSISFSKKSTNIARGSLDCGGFVAAGWNNNIVYLLDNNMNIVSQFPAGSDSPNGITTDGNLIYTGHFTTQEVIAYDMNGVEQFRWSGSLINLMGMVYINGEIAIASVSEIMFFDAATGAFIRDIPSGQSEGLAYDGTNIWSINHQNLNEIDPATGAVLNSIPNAASDCSFSGTGIAIVNENQIILSCPSGDWFIVSSIDGSVINSGNNGVDMYGLSGQCPLGAEPNGIPTLSQWGMFILFLLFLIMAIVFMKSRVKSSTFIQTALK